MTLRPLITALWAALALVAALAACSGNGVDLHDNPGRGVSKDNGPLTTPPANLERGTP